MKMTSKVTGLTGMINRLNKFEKEADEIVKKALQKRGKKMLPMAKLWTPKDTGLLMSSWKLKYAQDGHKHSIEMYNPVKYFWYIEQGHVIANQYGTYGYYQGMHTLPRLYQMGFKNLRIDIMQRLTTAVEGI